jgi:5'-methylthioadenosine phosphorylase
MLGLIASSGVSELGRSLGLAAQTLDTPYGPVLVRVGEVGGRRLGCVARHGEEGCLPPHRVEYRGLIWALADLGCTAVLATNAVGTLRKDVPPGTLCLPAQILDFTHARPRTFFEEELVAVDFTEPYCPRLAALVEEVAGQMGERVCRGLVYACMEGPRFESAAEIAMLQQLGADLVGMTAMPEAALAREKNLCYASLCVVTNWAAGVRSHHPSAGEVASAMQARWETIIELARRVAEAYVDDPTCRCHHAVK